MLGSSANGMEGLDGSQHALWERLEQDKGEEVEVDGLIFTLYPAPSPSHTAQPPSEEKEEKRGKEEEKTPHHMRDEVMV